MKKTIPLLVAAVLSIASVARATQADDAVVAITGHNTGPTPFINNVDVQVVPATNLKSIEFTIDPKQGSVTRPLSATYSTSYLNGRGYFDTATGQATVPVFGLYAAYNNSLTLTFIFADGSSKQSPFSITTAAYTEGGSCDFQNPTVIQARTNSTKLSYDFLLVMSSCNNNSPTIIDTDGAIRWVGTADVSTVTGTFYDNAVYLGDGPRLLRIEMDGTVTVIRDYTDQGIVSLHHNIEIGKRGLLISLDTQDQVESVNFEVDPKTGEILDQWHFATIIKDAIVAGGQEPGDFIRTANGRYDAQAPEDWWHNNTQTYRHADDTLLVSSRENFVIALDYETKAIKWIFGDEKKRWHQFTGLAKYAIATAQGTLAPDGQHTLSITKDNNLLLFDNGQGSLHQTPPGPTRSWSAPRKYALNLQAMVAQAIWRYDNNFSIFTPFCSGVYEDAPLNYVVDYAVIGGINANSKAQVFGLTAQDEVVFKYQYPTGACNDAYRSIPIHLEDTSFPTSNVHLANIASRSFVGVQNRVSIAGFIVPGNTNKPVVLRGIGPSIKNNGEFVAGRLMDPTLTLYNSDGVAVETNDNYKDGSAPEQAMINQAHLAPTDDHESAIARQLAPGSYTAVLSGVGGTTGIGVIEVYDLDPSNGPRLANLSTRAFVGTGDNVLIGGVLLRGNAIKRVVFRGIGPELQDAGIIDPLQDTNLFVVDSNGNTIANNDDWQMANNTAEIQQTGLQPTNAKESAILMPMIAGDYTVILGGKGATGTGLLEIYQLEE